MKRNKTAKALSLLMALMLVLQLLPLGSAVATDTEDAEGPAEVVETISGDEQKDGEDPPEDGDLDLEDGPSNDPARSDEAEEVLEGEDLNGKESKNALDNENKIDVLSLDRTTPQNIND